MALQITVTRTTMNPGIKEFAEWLRKSEVLINLLMNDQGLTRAEALQVISIHRMEVVLEELRSSIDGVEAAVVDLAERLAPPEDDWRKDEH